KSTTTANNPRGWKSPSPIPPAQIHQNSTDLLPLPSCDKRSAEQPKAGPKGEPRRGEQWAGERGKKPAERGKPTTTSPKATATTSPPPPGTSLTAQPCTTANPNSWAAKPPPSPAPRTKISTATPRAGSRSSSTGTAKARPTPTPAAGCG